MNLSDHVLTWDKGVPSDLSYFDADVGIIAEANFANPPVFISMSSVDAVRVYRGSSDATSTPLSNVYSTAEFIETGLGVEELVADGGGPGLLATIQPKSGTIEIRTTATSQ